MINVTANAAASIAYREAVFHVVPRSEWLRVYEASQKAAAVDPNKLVEQRKEWIAFFAKAKVSEKRVLGFLRVTSVDDISAEDLKRLKGVYTALSEGSLAVNDVFPPEDLKPGKQSASGKAKGGKKSQPSKQPPKKEATQPPEPQADEEPPHNAETGEVLDTTTEDEDW